MASRPGVWLRSLLAGLMDRPPLGYLPRPVANDRVLLVPIWPNRAQEKFNGPIWDRQTA